jgi:UDPglucose 6-dehydrogenase
LYGKGDFMRPTIGICGYGYVGRAVAAGFAAFPQVVYDKYLPAVSSVPSLAELARASGVCFVCVPTPPHSDGSCDTSIVDEVVRALCEANAGIRVVIKSTLVPGTTRRLCLETGSPLCVNPEFLTHRTHIQDFLNQSYVILGGEDLDPISCLYETALPSATIHRTDSMTAEMMKYAMNGFFSTKLAFANELFDLCTGLDLNYDQVVTLLSLDPRAGAVHWQVPGPDGRRGFGGACLPKDLDGLIAFARATGVHLTVAEVARAANTRLRS